MLHCIRRPAALCLILVGLAAAMRASEMRAAEEGAGKTPTDANKVDPKKLANEAFALTKTAQTEAEFTRIVALCQQAIDEKADEGTAAYARQLAGWSLNRRGESKAARAAQLAAQKKTEEAGALDREAMSDFQQAVTLNPKHWKALHNRGVSLAQTGKLREALADFSEAIRYNGDYPNTWFNRAEIYLEQGSYAEAIRDYSQALALKPGDAGFLQSRGHAYARADQHDKALADYDRALAANPNLDGIPLDRAESLAAAGRYDQAASLYRSALAQDKNGRTYRAAAWFFAACPEEKYQDAKQAVTAAEKAIALDGEKDYLYPYTLAAAYLAAGRLDEARGAMLRAISKAPPEIAAELKKELAEYEKEAPLRK